MYVYTVYTCMPVCFCISMFIHVHMYMENENVCVQMYAFYMCVHILNVHFYIRMRTYSPKCLCRLPVWIYLPY